ncbi:MAG: hypothetical protein QM800_07635 [Paludibacter sp.]
MELQAIYQIAIRFAARKHAERGQTLPDSIIPYSVHLSNVAMEILVAGTKTKGFDTCLAVQVALLHDTLEDTFTSALELECEFSRKVSVGVQALTKNKWLPKEEQMKDCLNRLKELPAEIQAVKLADRITNLQVPPPSWSKAKIKDYLNESELILAELKGSNSYLERRMKREMKIYSKYARY